jgi:hypothetical protein
MGELQKLGEIGVSSRKYAKTSARSFLQANVQKVEVNYNSIDRFNAIKAERQ